MSVKAGASGCLASFRERVRCVLYARARARVLVLGDSHVRVFEHWWFLWQLPRTRFDIVYVPGATAGGIGNRHSVSNAYNVFVQALQKSTFDLVMVNLGEVDTAYTLWKKVMRDGGDVQAMTDRSIRSYCGFLEETSGSYPLVVIAACLPTLADHASPGDAVAKTREAIQVSQQERTRLALYFNQAVARFCEERHIPFLDGDAIALGEDGLLREDWINHDHYDHHYARNPYARWLAGRLKGMVTPGGTVLK